MTEQAAEHVINAEFPAKLQPLFRPARYKILYGGRGSAKSWSTGRALLLQGMERPLRILCAREIQDSIDQSVHKLLADRIAEEGLSEYYKVQKNEISNAIGTSFGFHGLKHNIDSLKSAEGIDVCWVTEAVNVSKASWDKLIPTIRKDGSEIWIDFNPELDSDETYKRFVLNPPEGAVVIKMNHDDNPWFPEVLRKEMQDLKAKDPDGYMHVYEGHCKQTLDGAVYATELRKAQLDGRIRSVPYDASKAVHVFCDLGWGDYTSLWFVQRVGLEYRVLASYQNRGRVWSEYLKVVQDTDYLIDTIWLPHDGRSKTLGTGKSIEDITKEAGFRCRIVPKLSLIDGINAAREVFPFVWIDEEQCVDGLQSLRHYVWEPTNAGTHTSAPKHDEHSHYADSWRYMAIGLREPRKEIVVKQPAPKLYVPTATGAWMR